MINYDPFLPFLPYLPLPPLLPFLPFLPLLPFLPFLPFLLASLYSGSKMGISSGRGLIPGYLAIQETFFPAFSVITGNKNSMRKG